MDKLVKILEMAAYGRESNVCHLIERPQLLQRHFAYDVRGDLAAQTGGNRSLIFDFVYKAFNIHPRHGPLLNSPFQTRLDLVTVKRLAPAVPLYHHKRFLLYPLIAGKPAAADRTLPAAPDGGAVGKSPRFKYLIFYVTAMRAPQA
jgi:hypothetical protein